MLQRTWQQQQDYRGGIVKAQTAGGSGQRPASTLPPQLFNPGTQTNQEKKNEDLKLKYYNMMIRFALKHNAYLDAAKYYYKNWETPSIKEEVDGRGREALEHIVYYVVLAPHDNEQSDMLHRLFNDPALKRLELQHALKTFGILKSLSPRSSRTARCSSAPPATGKRKHPHDANVPMSTPPASASTPAANAPTPTRLMSSPQTSKSPKTRAPAKTKAPPKPRKPNAKATPVVDPPTEQTATPATPTTLDAWRTRFNDLLRREGETSLVRWEFAMLGTPRSPLWVARVYIRDAPLAIAAHRRRSGAEDRAAEQAYRRVIGDISAY
ncbi:hypothetical protein OBBRIDRAFT_836297 [Obba rivulosa]|uniref:PSMD12/CSN4-like N-terminal domain-containing protein n=1 Tax=Obba rivulosa TaxID=1052685 RepID=A0A8E2DN10_9APHY|nr:hypothetical protein OBBRIDRAFT_836297 [Obba rivulosa]